MSKFSTSSEKVLLQTDLFDVNEIDIVKESGEKTIWHSVQVKPVVAILALTEKKEIYLIKQYRYRLKKTSFEIPAGYINQNEDPLDAAKRELKEETGLEAKEWMLLGMRKVGANAVTGDFYYYFAQNLHSGEQRLDDSEDIQVLTVPFADAVEKAVTGEILVNSNIVGIFLLKEFLSKHKK